MPAERRVAEQLATCWELWLFDGREAFWIALGPLSGHSGGLDLGRSKPGSCAQGAPHSNPDQCMLSPLDPMPDVNRWWLALLALWVPEAIVAAHPGDRRRILAGLAGGYRRYHDQLCWGHSWSAWVAGSSWNVECSTSK